MSLVGRSLPSRWREGAARAVDAPVFFWLRPRPRRPPRSESVAAGRVPTKSVLQSERENYDSNNKRPVGPNCSGARTKQPENGFPTARYRVISGHRCRIGPVCAVAVMVARTEWPGRRR